MDVCKKTGKQLAVVLCFKMADGREYRAYYEETSDASRDFSVIVAQQLKGIFVYGGQKPGSKIESFKKLYPFILDLSVVESVVFTSSSVEESDIVQFCHD